MEISKHTCMELLWEWLVPRSESNITFLKKNIQSLWKTKCMYNWKGDVRGAYIILIKINVHGFLFQYIVYLLRNGYPWSFSIHFKILDKFMKCSLIDVYHVHICYCVLLEQSSSSSTAHAWCLANKQSIAYSNKTMHSF